MWETWVGFLGWEVPLEKGKAPHSSILAWRIHGLYTPQGCKESDTIEWLLLLLFILFLGFPRGAVVKNLPSNVGDARDTSSIRRSERSPGIGKGNPHQYSCLGSPWSEEPCRLQSMGSQKSRTWLRDWTELNWDYSPPGFSLHGISEARILQWVDISFSRGSPWSRYQTRVSCFVGEFFNTVKLSNF